MGDSKDVAKLENAVEVSFELSMLRRRSLDEVRLVCTVCDCLVLVHSSKICVWCCICLCASNIKPSLFIACVNLDSVVSIGFINI